VFSVVFKVGPQTAISMESSRRALSIDMAVCESIWKIRKKNDMVLFYLHPKIGIVVP